MVNSFGSSLAVDFRPFGSGDFQFLALPGECTSPVSVGVQIGGPS